MNHGLNFQRAAAAMHLVPSLGPKGWKATGRGADFEPTFGVIISSLGAYPHAALTMSTKKTQGTRMLKAVCPSCGYTVRLTAKWADLGLPSCPVDHDTLNLV
jgi:hypothetical protein